MPSAAVIIIGHEILTGKFADDNGPYLIRRLRALGCDLGRLTVLADDVAQIADEVRRCAATFDLVVTTGGVGPTHDDVTLEGVAAAFDEPLEVSRPIVSLMEQYEIEVNDTTLRMARIPRGSELVSTSASSYPVLRVRNVYILPGVPKLMQVKFEGIADRFAGEAMHVGRLHIDQRESEIAGVLDEAAARYPTVGIGSYPRFGEGPFKVIVTLESRDEGELRNAEAHLRARLSVVLP